MLTRKIPYLTASPPLTRREREVVQLSCYGLCVKQIARELHIEHSTVKSNLTSIFRKFNCVDRINMVCALWAYGGWSEESGSERTDWSPDWLTFCPSYDAGASGRIESAGEEICPAPPK
jgi:DNA-binding CsgD family transcriptional regulator